MLSFGNDGPVTDLRAHFADHGLWQPRPITFGDFATRLALTDTARHRNWSGDWSDPSAFEVVWWDAFSYADKVGNPDNDNDPEPGVFATLYTQRVQNVYDQGGDQLLRMRDFYALARTHWPEYYREYSELR